MYRIRLVLSAFFLAITLNVSAQNDAVELHGATQSTSYTVRYFDSGNRNFSAEIDSILLKINNIFSVYDSLSVLSKFNKNQSFSYDSLFLHCIKRSLYISQLTNGAFDITVAPLVTAWGFGPQRKSMIDKHIIDSIKHFVDFRLIAVTDSMVIKKDSRITITCNAIAQGFSVDLVSTFLLQHQITNFFVEIGGEVYTHGTKPDGSAWIIGVEKPIDNQTANLNELTEMVQLSNRAISTSGNYRNFYLENGIKYSHTINPQLGYPSKNNILSATIIADNCADADAFATACMVMGVKASIKFLKKHPELEALLIYSDERGYFNHYLTKGFEALTIKKQ